MTKRKTTESRLCNLLLQMRKQGIDLVSARESNSKPRSMGLPSLCSLHICFFHFTMLTQAPQLLRPSWGKGLHLKAPHGTLLLAVAQTTAAATVRKCSWAKGVGSLLHTFLCLLCSCPRDPNGFNDWTFSTVRCWGERAKGTYRLVIRDVGKPACLPARAVPFTSVVCSSGSQSPHRKCPRWNTWGSDQRVAAKEYAPSTEWALRPVH